MQRNNPGHPEAKPVILSEAKDLLFELGSGIGKRNSNSRSLASLRMTPVRLAGDIAQSVSHYTYQLL
jgi:hypothetical protein